MCEKGTYSARCVRETNIRDALCQAHCRMCAPWMHVSDSTRLDALVIDEVSFCSASEIAAAYYRIKHMSKNNMPVA